MISPTILFVLPTTGLLYPTQLIPACNISCENACLRGLQVSNHVGLGDLLGTQAVPVGTRQVRVRYAPVPKPYLMLAPEGPEVRKRGFFLTQREFLNCWQYFLITIYERQVRSQLGTIAPLGTRQVRVRYGQASGNGAIDKSFRFRNNSKLR